MSDRIWYVGIDFGTTGISAVLLNAATQLTYPLYWIESDQLGSTSTTPTLKKHFRLTPAIYLSVIEGEPSQALAVPHQASSASWSVGPLAVKIANATADRSDSGLLLHNLKPLLKLATPYYCPETEQWEPILQWSPTQQVSMGWIRQALQALFTAMTPLSSQVWLYSAASGLDNQTFREATENLGGAILGCPAYWPDTYRFNLREAILGAKLVEHPEQVVFIEDAIATILSELRDTAAGYQWRGHTLAINSGATMTELVLVDLPNQHQKLTHPDFKLRSFAYGGQAIDQDIISQLFLPQAEETLCEDLNIPLESWPTPGEANLEQRYRLQRDLESTLLGRALLHLAGHVKQVLQHQDRYQCKLGKDRTFHLRRKELEMQVFLPFMRRLNQEFNALLSETGVATQGIQQAMCTGGTASIGPITRWLRQKLPSAAIIQDTYPADRSPGCSRVAYGLATLAFYPQILELSRQQYHDYFLLRELLKNLPTQPTSAQQILQRLERQGINTRVCAKQVVGFLEGKLPPGLVPTDCPSLLATTAAQNPDYQVLSAAPLFEKTEDRTYNANSVQCDRARQYLDRILEGSMQTLEEPYTVRLGFTRKP